MIGISLGFIFRYIRKNVERKEILSQTEQLIYESSINMLSKLRNASIAIIVIALFKIV